MKVTGMLKTQIVWVIVFLTPWVTYATRVACVGDSNTFGFGLERLSAYPVQLEGILQQCNVRWEVQNFGLNGATVLRYGDISYRRQPVCQSALAYEPDVVIFCFGPNETRSPNRMYIHEHFVADYVSLIEAFAILDTAPELWICQPLAAFSSEWTISPEIIENDIVPLVNQVAAETGIPVIDFYTVFKDAPHLYQNDGIHPTADGARLMAEIVAASITGIRTSPDLNSDGIVDSEDMCILVDHWHMNELSCDIAPPPFGDGIVDVQDLVALAKYLFTYPGAVAYWRLDETEGDVAHDSVAANDAVVIGNAIWQVDAGQIGGAIQLDGITGYVKAPPVLNPADSPFSVLGWIKCSTAGQVILSQSRGQDWLLTDSGGALMTDLKGAGQQSKALRSQVVITDGEWHHVALTWGDRRTLYVDEVSVAEDEPALPADISEGVHIGAGADLESGTFFSGLIDEVRIYNRAVRP